MIIKAAIKKCEVIYSGRCHSDIILNNLPIDFGTNESEEGFLDDKGNFLNRQKAAEHAFECGQIKERKHILYSDNIGGIK